MVSLDSYVILIFICLLGGYNQSGVGCIGASKVEHILKKRGTGIPYENLDRLATDVTTEATETAEGSCQRHAACFHTFSQNHDTGDGGKAEKDAWHGKPSNNKKELSPERKAEIANKLLNHQEEAVPMRTDLRLTRKWMSVFNKQENVDLLRRYGKVAADRTTDDILEDLSNYHKYILRLVQHRLYRWGGLRGLILQTKDNRKEGKGVSEDLDLNSSQKLNLNLMSEKGKEQDTGATSRKLPSSQLLGYPALLEVRDQKMKKMRDSAITKSKKQQQLSRETAGSQQHAGFLPQAELRGDGPIVIICEKMRASGVMILHEILRSITISTDEEAMTPESELSSYINEERRLIKISFEMCIFKGLEFLYNFHFIAKNAVRSFFSDKETLAITALHITDLFHMNEAGFFMCQAFVPEITFIGNHFTTKHMHQFLEDLEKEEQGYIIFKTLQATVKAFHRTEAWLGHPNESIHGFFIGESASAVFDIKPKPNLNSIMGGSELNNESKKGIEELIKYFQNSTSQQPLHMILLTGRISFLLAYHILNFIKVYHSEILASILPETTDHATLELQLVFIEAGLEFHHNFNQVMYPDFIDDDGFLERMLYDSKKGETEQKIKKLKKLEDSSSHYLQFRKKISVKSNESLVLRNWSEGRSISRSIIDFLTNTAKMWEKSRAVELSEKNNYVNAWMFKAGLSRETFV